MTPERFTAISAEFPKLRIAVVGDFCLDRYLEIDPTRSEVSIETGLPVHNVVRVRAQPGAAGTIVNNLVALGIGEILLVGFCGDDGEGFELLRALGSVRGMSFEHFVQTAARRTFTYCKPLILKPGEPPQELNRLDSKNWEPTPGELSSKLAASIRAIGGHVEAMIVMDQVDLEGTGVVTAAVLNAIGEVSRTFPDLPIVADSRRGLGGYPPCIFKMNAAELAALTGRFDTSLEHTAQSACLLAQKNGRPAIVTMAEQGLIGAKGKHSVHVPALPLRGPIDVVGAGDSVTANVTAALAAGSTLREALEIAAVASSLVVHQLGTSGAASAQEIAALLK